MNNDIFNNNREVSDDNLNMQYPQQQFPEYQQPLIHDNDINQQNFQHEVSYYPNSTQPPKKKKHVGKVILNTVLVLACAGAVSFLSIAGYIAVTGNNPGTQIEAADDSEANGNNSVDDSKDLPTLMQMAARDDALSIPEIVEKVSPSVVGISSIITSKNDFTGGAATGTSTGTGIIMTEDGYIITNAHVVSDATSINVVISIDDTLEETKATLIGIDSQTDLAVLKVDKTGLTPAEFGQSSDLLVGELAIAIGNPLGFELAGSVTGGIISALDRELTIEDKTFSLIQTDAAINAGNSGGPLINSYGQVIGINSAKISSSSFSSVEGLGFAIPIDQAKPIIDDLIQYGYVKGRPMLGISGEDISAVISRYYNLPQGIMVRFVEEESGAEAAGIEVGDIIVAVDSVPVTDMSELNSIKNTHTAGDTITLTVYRDGKNMDIDVVLNEAKKSQ